jgi:hypothetical protein
LRDFFTNPAFLAAWDIIVPIICKNESGYDAAYKSMEEIK